MMEKEDERDVLVSTKTLETLNPDSQKKHEAMLERLSNRHQSRPNHSVSHPAESTQSFLNLFSESKRLIQSDLNCLRGISSDPQNQPDLKSQLQNLSVAVADLEKLVAENSYFLPSYEIRSSLKSISELKESLEDANAELLPRKKFSFRNKAAKKNQAETMGFAEKLKIVEKTKEAECAPFDTKAGEKSNFAMIRESPGFQDEVGAVFVKEFKGFEESDFTLSNLESCQVWLKGRLRALFVHRLKNCRVCVGPVLGSVLIEQVEGCLFMLASHQIRIHHAKVTDFYLRVRSRPIVEDCSGVRFAPYVLTYEGIEEELMDSGLGEETGNWANVDDFRWLRAVQSPNWCILPDEERINKMDISELDAQK